MLNWVKEHVLGGTRRLIDLGHRVVDVVSHFWNTIVGFWHVLRTVFADLGHTVSGWLHFLLNFIEWTAKTLWHAATVAIPNAARWALREAVSWSGAAVSRIHALLSAALRVVRDWAARELAGLLVLLRNGLQWVQDLFGPVLNWISRYGNRVVDLVLHPDRLAAWIVPALWGPLWRYLQARAPTIGSWFLRRSIASVGPLAGMIESVLAKIL